MIRTSLAVLILWLALGLLFKYGPRSAHGGDTVYQPHRTVASTWIDSVIREADSVTSAKLKPEIDRLTTIDSAWLEKSRSELNELREMIK